jgi:diphthamide biosynthesis enzyme Dph1/Dph2-like protein
VDAVAAEHYEADSLIHYGHSCLSVVDKIPVLYVFEKCPINLSTVETEINTLVANNTPDQKLVILYDVQFSYLYGTNFWKKIVSLIFLSLAIHFLKRLFVRNSSTMIKFTFRK